MQNAETIEEEVLSTSITEEGGNTDTVMTPQMISLKCRGQSAFSYKKRDSSNYNTKCSYFIEPMDWIFDDDDQEKNAGESNLEGKIKCPKCKFKLGNYSWAGMQCSCGTWVTPSFAIHKEKIDEVYS
ncbi:17003_t:CDS:2 [Acaulospora morrowiae]|uniref:protein-tyrosine-phosphatase n=1 Tax=Acaulospora morrowiae TaxID=94023 RepID=A0A9N9AVA7_9GLOM|nr:17003_t:CDS:2 [Acaulospora morrowiae]